MTPSVLAIGIVICLTAIFGVLAKVLKQPIIPAYILAGFVAGPIVFGLIEDPHAIANMSEMTIIFVMFAIGLEMDIDRIKSVGTVVTLGGILQVVSISLIGFGASLLWFDLRTSLYLGLMISFASTALVVKLMADKRQLDTLQGGITLGILLLQDIIAIIILSLLPAKDVSVSNLLGLGLKTFGIVFVGLLAGQHIFPKILCKVSDSSEIMTLASLGIGCAFAFLAESQGLSMSIGAFITGVSLANLPYGLELQARMKSIRDFFLPIFFASLGIQITLPGAGMILPIIVLTLICLILKPLAIAILTALFGYQKRTAYYVGVSLVPVSEFGLVIIALGIKLGHIPVEAMTLSITVMALTMLLSAYLYVDGVYLRLTRFLGFLDRIGPDSKVEKTLSEAVVDQEYDVVVIGLHRMGRYVYEALCKLSHRVLVIEHSFERVRTLIGKHIPCILGDATVPEVWEKLDLSKVKMVVSTIPDYSQSLMILRFLKEKWPEVKIVLAAEHLSETHALIKAGADYVLCPPTIAGESIRAGVLNAVLSMESIAAESDKLVTQLEVMMAEWDVNLCILPACNCNGKK